jgi:hypothetical protein
MKQEKQRPKQNLICDKYKGVIEHKESVIMILKDLKGNKIVRKL